MNNYEMVCILDPQVGEGRFEETIGGYEKYLEGQGVEIVHIDRWGMRKLAYTSVALQRRQQGYYILFQIRSDAAVLLELEQRLRLDADVLRYLVVSVDGEFQRVPQLAPEGLLAPSSASRGRGPERSGEQPAQAESKTENKAEGKAESAEVKSDGQEEVPVEAEVAEEEPAS
ncbi:MAG: 30S ribosomal protein S6 [Candidatus Latescibacteria bacterium]|nr:30S ribosomal protein S6 [Candidatus Latescibacterota bacterium]